MKSENVNQSSLLVLSHKRTKKETFSAMPSIRIQTCHWRCYATNTKPKSCRHNVIVQSTKHTAPVWRPF